MPLRRQRDGRKKKRSRYLTGRRTDTVERRILTTEDGDVHSVRVDGTHYPKDTTVAISRPLKKLLWEFKLVDQYPNMDELIFDLLMAKIEAGTVRISEIPKTEKIIEQVKYDIKLKHDARMRAKAKGRYFPSEQRKPRFYYEIEEAATEMTEAIGGRRPKRRITDENFREFFSRKKERERYYRE